MYAIRNLITMAFLRTSMLNHLVFTSRAEARAYMQQHNLNPHYFEIVAMTRKMFGAKDA